MRNTALALALSLTVFQMAQWMGSASAVADSLGFSISEKASNPAAPNDLTVVVQDDLTGQPINDAVVSLAPSFVGSRAGSSNEVKTTSLGAANFRASRASDAHALTVSKAGYTTVSLAGFQGKTVTVFLKPLRPSTPDVIASGKLSGFTQASSSEAIQAGIVFKSFGANDLLNFDSSSFISPLKDKIEVYGTREIPSNMVLPEQDVFLPFGSISLNKPIYRLPLIANRPVTLTAVQAEIKVGDVIPAAQGGGLTVDILNSLTFTRVGMSQKLNPKGDVTESFNGTVDLSAKHTVSVENPPFKGNVIVAAATDLNGDRQTLVPTDIKTALNADKPDEKHDVSLVAPVQNFGKGRVVLTLAESDQGTRMSGILTDNAGPSIKPGVFLPADLLGEFQKLPETIKLKAPSQGVGAVGFNSDQQLVWMVYTLPAAGEVTVPTQKLSADAKINKFALYQLDFGSSFNERAIDGKAVMTRLERFTRASSSQTQPTPAPSSVPAGLN